MSQENDQRQFSRILFDTPALIRQQDREWTANVLDVSLKGVLISHQEWDLDTSQPTEIDIQLDGKLTISMHAHWVHSEADHSGFCCDHIDLDSITHLRRLVELNLGSPDLLERELNLLG